MTDSPAGKSLPFRVEDIIESTADAFVAMDEQWRYTYVSKKAEQLLHHPREALLGRNAWEVFSEAVDTPFFEMCQRAVREQKPTYLLEHYAPFDKWFEVRAFPLQQGLSVYFTDVTERVREEEFQKAEAALLKMIVTGRPLDEILEGLARAVETRAPHLRAAVLLLGAAGRRLQSGAAPSLPPDFVKEMHHLEVGPAAAAAGAAVHTRETVLTTDIATDPRWADYRGALDYGLHACWAKPILTSEGAPLGVFALYAQTARTPRPDEEGLLEFASDLAGIAIERNQNARVLRESEARLRFLSDASGLLAAEADDQTVLDNLARLATATVADYCLVDLLTDDGELRRMAVAAREPAREALIHQAYTLSPTCWAESPLYRDLTPGDTRVISQCTPAWRAQAALSPEHRRLLDAVDPCSMMLVPITLRERLLGVMCFISTQPDQPYGPEDAAVAEELARRAGAALENRRLLQDLQGALYEVGELAAQRSAILAQITDGVIVTDRSGHITFVNAAAAKIHGIAELHIAPDAYADHYRLLTLDGKPYPPGELPLTRAVLHDETVVDALWKICRPDGTEVVAQGSATPVRAEDGTKLGAALTLRDVTRQRELEASLRTSEARYRALIDATTQVVWTTPASGEFETEQPSWSAFTGQSFEELRGWGWLDAVHPDDRAHTVAAWNAALAEHSRYEVEHRLCRQDQEYRHMIVRAVPVLDDDGAVREWVGMQTDITEQRQMEEALRASEEQLQALFSQASVGIVQTDLSGRFVLVNEWFCKLVGRGKDELLGMQTQDITHAQDLPRSQELFRQMLTTGTNFTTEQRYVRADGTPVWVSTTVSPVRDPDGALLYTAAIVQDLTDKRRIEELQRSNRDLEQFAYVASHDLQEPLRRITSFADLLQIEYADQMDETAQQYVRRMQASAERMAALIRDLLAFSRVTSRGRPMQEVDLNEVIGQVVTDVEAELQQVQGSIVVDDLPVVEADPVQMHQLFQNLISNGLKFRHPDAPPAIRITNTVTEISSDEGELRPASRITVEDNGIGFDEKYLDRIFQPFERLHHRGTYAGTGIGLAICQRVVERHGGTITAESRPDHGATFIITLPLHRRRRQVVPQYGLTEPTEEAALGTLARTFGTDEAEQIWERACAAAGFERPGPPLSLQQMRLVADTLSREPGAVGVTGTAIRIRIDAYLKLILTQG